ncbi:MAG TPA: amylo-alpha-1,6-glucosidase [Acidimicrobiales bacterium]
MTTEIRVGRQVTGDLDEASAREWLVSDGAGGYAMGTAGGLRTRRYHGLLVVATQAPIGRMMGLIALDPILVLGDRHIRLATHEWSDGTIAPAGHLHLASFSVRDGLPSWRWAVGDIVVQAEVAMVHGRPAVGVTHRLVHAPQPVRLELEVLCTWRDVHGERFAAADPDVEATADGLVFEHAYRVRGPAFDATGASWWRGERHREEAARGLNDREDIWRAGTFSAELHTGDEIAVEAWAGDLESAPPHAATIIDQARQRTADLVAAAGARDDDERHLVLAADQFVVHTSNGATVVAGYPWFGDWSRDSLTSYEGLFLCANRIDAGRALLERMASTVSEGMLANTADAGGLEYNTVDAAMWFLHALSRHVTVSGDADLAHQLATTVRDIVDHHMAGTRFGIKVDSDGLITQGAEGWALTWMDARVDGTPITPRVGKPVEVNALWISGLQGMARLLRASDPPLADNLSSLAARARRSFIARFVRPDGLGLLDVVDPDDATVRPNQLLAVSLPDGPIDDPTTAVAIVRACAPLVTSIGMRSLTPDDPGYIGRHRGGPAERDRAYHQGTVWPWLLGPYVDACRWAGLEVDGLIDGALAHIGEWGLGSVSETADGDLPHRASGCPFQAWSVAELLRAKRSATM